MQKLCVMTVLVAAMVLAAPAVGSQAVAPDVLLKGLTSEILEVVSRDKDIQAGNDAKLANLVEGRIVPLFDFARMTQIAMAHNWPLTTPEQQKALIAEFRTLLVRTYSVTLKNYRGQAVEFKPLNVVPDDSEVTVKSVMRQLGVQPVTIDYQMGKTPAGWKVHEVTVDGVNLIANFRSTFASRVRDGGVDGLVRALRDKNLEQQASRNTR